MTATITPTLIKQSFELTAGFYAAGIQCPQLVSFNKWLIGEMSIRPIADTTATTAHAPPIAEKVDFTEAVEQALKSSPNGISPPDLRAVLAHLNEPPANIGAALGRLKRQNLAEKRGDLWFAIGAAAVKTTRAKPAKAANGKIDRSMGNRRNRRQATAGAQQGENGGETHQEAAAG